MLPEKFECYLVTKDAERRGWGRIARRAIDELPPGDALVRVAYSSLNYKDALAAKGNPGVVRRFPHVPGIDAAGVVVSSGVYELAPGDRVVITGFELGAARWGGFAEYVSVPFEWIVPLPEELSLRESMILGTAGFTAALSVDTLQKHGVEPDSGRVVVTGASGGVGSMAVAILAGLGYRVVAVTGKPDAAEYLHGLGAEEIVGRQAVDDRGGRPLLGRRWAGAVDTVGGNILATILRTTGQRGCVAACGLTAGAELPLTVYPFILRGVTLAGIDSISCPAKLRHDLWRRLAGDWRPERLESMAAYVGLEELPPPIDHILDGKITGRVVVTVGGEEIAGDD